MNGAESYSILAVDDNELNLGLFRLFLKQLGHTAIAVNNPEEAIRLSAEQHFNLIFTDIQMPGMSGIEASEKFRQNGFTGPILAITAHLSAEEREQITSSSISDVLIKPVSKSELERVLNRWLGNENLKVESTQATYTVSEAKVYDLELALSRSNGSVEIAEEMFTLLLEHLREIQTQLDTELDAQAFRALLHKLMGGLKFTGASQLEQRVAKIQRGASEESIISDHISLVSEGVQAVLSWAEQHPAPFKN